MMHYWGDEWPHWDELYTAISYFDSMYCRITKKFPSTKEKYGTMRFEYTWSWIENEQHVKLFKHLIRKMVTKFPNVAGEVCHDAGHVLNDVYFEGWCAGVAYKSNGSYWSSKARPKGV